MARRLLGERGESLVEVVLTSTIISVAVVGIITGIGTAARSSQTQRNIASASVALAVAAEAVDAHQTTGSATCPGTSSTIPPSMYSGSLTTIPAANLPEGWTTSVLAVASVTCSSVGGTLLPHVLLRATPPDGSAQETMVVVRRSVP